MNEWLRDNPKILEEVISKTSNDEVTLKLGNFLQMLQASAGPDLPPQNHFVSKAKFEGKALPEAVELNCVFEVYHNLFIQIILLKIQLRSVSYL